MKIRRIIYIVLFLAVVVMNVVFPDYLPFLLLWIMVFIPVAMAGFGILMKNSVKVSLTVTEKHSVRGLSVHYHVRVQNRMFMMIDDLSMVVANQYHNLEEPLKKEHHLEVQSLQTEELKSEYKICYSGSHDTYLEEITFYDPLKLFLFHIKCSDRFHIEAMPVLVQPENALLTENAEDITEAFEFSGNRQGEDASEIFDVRAYRGGDSINRVHWKLSAKSDSLMVKEFSLPISKSNALVVEIHHCKCEEDRRKLDGIYELAYAMGNLCVLKEKEVTVFGYDQGLSALPVTSIEENEAMVMALLKISGVEENPAWDAFSEEAQAYENVLYLTDRLDDEMLMFLNTVHPFHYSCFCFENADARDEITAFEGGNLIMVNDQEIHKSLCAVVI